MTASGADLYEVLRQVRPLHLTAARIVADAMAEQNLTLGIRAVLEVVAERGPQPVPGIARTLLLPRQDVQRLCNQALQRRLIAREPNPAHRRSPLMALTDEGRRRFTEIHTAELDRLDGLARAVTAADAHTCARVLAGLTDALRAMRGGRPAPGPAAVSGSAP